MTIRRPRRIAADEASSWARNLRLGNPHAKSIMNVLALYVNEQGVAWPGLATLSSDTDISEDTILRRLRWLEAIGAIAMFKCWVDDSGVRNRAGRGRPSSSDIQFLFDADIEAIEVAAAEGIEGRPALKGAAKRSHDERISTRPLRQQNDDEESVSTQLATVQPPQAAARHIENLEQEDSLPTLPSGGLEEKPDIEKVREAEAAEARWQQFKVGYPDGMTDPVRAKEEFLKLPGSDQAGAIAGIAIYGPRCQFRHEKPMKAHLYLKKRTWEGLLASAPATGADVVGGPYDPHSEAGKAILALVRIGRSSVPKMGDGRLIYPHPITAQLLALAQAPPGGKRYAPGTGYYRSWFDFLRAHLTLMPRLPEIAAPWPYPPSLTGKIYEESTGHDPPPQDHIDGTLATEDDLEEMAKG